MARFQGRPFLDMQIHYLSKYGIKRVILCLGYKANVVKSHYKNKRGIIFSQEFVPLGTAGAIKKAQRLIKSNPFLVLNGDSICSLDLVDFLNFHKNKSAWATVCLVRTNRSAERSDFGAVTLDSKKRIVKFLEKKDTRANFTNAGIYLFDKKVLSQIPVRKKYSLELDLFKKPRKDFYGFIAEGPCIDIGTPARFEKAKKVLAEWKF